MMEYDFKTHPFVKLTEAVQPEEMAKNMQTVLLAGKAFESIAVSNAKYVLDNSYQQTVRILEELDQQWFDGTPVESLRFPFDLMDQVTRNAASQWGRMSSDPSATNEELNQFKQTVQELEQTVGSLEQAIAMAEIQQQDAEETADKAHKAKLTAQRNSRKLKVEIEEHQAAFEAQKSQLQELEAYSQLQAEELETLQNSHDMLKAQLEQVQTEFDEFKHQAQQNSSAPSGEASA
ncbi:hypothetical protein ABT56_16465 [Photobacterium aquae]|uniref:Uncharacterized protein n=1 Tax=Photobacterium aquae TaxID=1195763 RepID=A0A0J1JPP1_9GAMM|nr:hypothetical protein [Photobacterium aquae]KLV04197.1 hypothetical protein ABT56_16465 [Photobacterium aquae]